MKKLIVTTVAAEAIYPLRQSVLRPEKAYEFSVYPADQETSTLHLGAYFQRELVGIASIYRETNVECGDNAAWRLRDMGVVESMRRKKVGRVLLESCVSHIISNQGTLFWCYARKSAIAFYTAQNFQHNGSSIELDGFGQRFFMWRSLKPRHGLALSR